MRGQQGGGVVLGLEVVGEGHALALGLGFAQRLELFAALGDELVFVLGGWRVLRVRHGEPWVEARHRGAAREAFLA